MSASKLSDTGIPNDVIRITGSRHLHYLVLWAGYYPRGKLIQQKDVMDVSQTYFALEMDLRPALVTPLSQFELTCNTDDVWQRKAKAGLGDEVDNSLRTLTQEVIQSNTDINDL